MKTLPHCSVCGHVLAYGPDPGLCPACFDKSYLGKRKDPEGDYATDQGERNKTFTNLHTLAWSAVLVADIAIGDFIRWLKKKLN